MTDTGARLRALFEEIAPAVDIRGAMASRERVAGPRRGWVIALAVASAVGLVGLGGWLLASRRGAEPPVITTPPIVTSTTTPSTTTTTAAALTIRLLAPTGIEVVSPAEGTFLTAVVDGSGVVWGVGSAGLTRFDPATGDTRLWTVADDEAFANLAEVAPSRVSGVWLGSGPGGSFGPRLARFDGGNTLTVIEAPGAVLALAEAADGSLWAVVAHAGVVRWDGSAWWGTGITSVGQTSVIAADDLGGVWVGNGGRATSDGGAPERFTLSHYDGEAWTDYTLDELGGGPVQGIALQSDATVWACARGRVYHLAGGTWAAFDIPQPVPECQSLAITPGGEIWLSAVSAEDGEVLAARLRGQAWTTYGAEEGLPADGGWAVGDLAATEDGMFLANGSVLFEFGNERWVPALSVSPAPWWLDPMLAISGAELWGAAWDAVWHFADGGWQAYTVADGLPPYAYIRDLASGPGGTIWVATDRGVASFAAGAWVVVDEEPASAVAAGPDGTVWAARAVVAAEGEPGTIVAFKSQGDTWAADRVVEHPLDWIDSLAVGNDGSVWIGSHNGGMTLPGRGLARFDGTDWEVTDHLGTYPISMVGDIAIAPNGDVWTIVVDEHDATPLVVQWDGQRWVQHAGVLEGAGFDLYHRLWVTAGGIVQAAGPHGLMIYDGVDWTTRYGGDRAFPMSVAPDGTVWMSSGAGVVRYPGG